MFKRHTFDLENGSWSVEDYHLPHTPDFVVLGDPPSAHLSMGDRKAYVYSESDDAGEALRSLMDKIDEMREDVKGKRRIIDEWDAQLELGWVPAIYVWTEEYCKEDQMSGSIVSKVAKKVGAYLALVTSKAVEVKVKETSEAEDAGKAFMAPKKEGKWMSVAEYAAKYGMSKSTVSRWAKSGKLGSAKDGKRNRTVVFDKPEATPVLDWAKKTWSLVPISQIEAHPEDYARIPYGKDGATEVVAYSKGGFVIAGPDA